MSVRSTRAGVMVTEDSDATLGDQKPAISEDGYALLRFPMKTHALR